MEKYNLKIGQKVRVRMDLSLAKTYKMKYSREKNTVNADMAELRGKIVTIYKYSCGQYKIKEDYNRWHWVDEMFEDLDNRISLSALQERL